MPHHAMLPVTPSFGGSSALDYKASENNKNNTTDDVLLAQNNYRKTQDLECLIVLQTCVFLKNMNKNMSNNSVYCSSLIYLKKHV